MPGDFPLGSPESRAAARRAVDAIDAQVPPLVIAFVACGPRDENGRLLGPPPESQSGCIDKGDGTRIPREPGESLERFKNRLLAASLNRPRICYLYPPDDAA
jgi:hypothetical protein